MTFPAKRQEEYDYQNDAKPVTLRGALSGAYSLSKPIHLEVIRDEQGAYVVSDSITTVYGYGDDSQTAINDYVASLIEYYELLEQSENERAGELRAPLNQYITKSS
jgi:hypothetical protein